MTANKSFHAYYILSNLEETRNLQLIIDLNNSKNTIGKFILILKLLLYWLLHRKGSHNFVDFPVCKKLATTMQLKIGQEGISFVINQT